MTGSKRNKIKKVFSTTSASPPPPAEDDGLLDDLIAHLDAREPAVQSEAAAVIQDVERNRVSELNASRKKDSKGRFEARKARKANAYAEQLAPVDQDADARIQQETKNEEEAIKRVCDELRLTLYDINPDGHCLFAAVADQLRLLGILPIKDAHYATTRLAASQYMFSHPNDFLPFLPSVDGEDGAGSTDAGIMIPGEFERYCAKIRNTSAWGGEPEILALCKAYNVPIHVVQAGNPPVVAHNPTGGQADDMVGQADDMRDKRTVRISYHRRMYGLGEHYNSLRPKTSIVVQLQSMVS